MIKFLYSSLLMASKSRPAGYLDEVKRNGRKVGQYFLMSSDAYRMIREKYVIATPCRKCRK